MTVNAEAFKEISKFLKKILYTIDQQSSFRFMNKCFVNKTRIDDILCCIESNFSEELKKRKTLKSMQLYKELVKAVHHKSFFSDNCYVVNYSEVHMLVEYVMKNFKRDFDYLDSLDKDMF